MKKGKKAEGWGCMCVRVIGREMGGEGGVSYWIKRVGGRSMGERGECGVHQIGVR